MDLLRHRAGSALPFAHLLGFGGRRAAAETEREDKDTAEDPKPGEHAADPKREDGESDDDYAKRCAEARKRAEEKEPEERADAEDGDPDDKEDDEESTDDEATRKAKSRARKSFARGVRGGRLAEQTRCRAIFASPAAGKRPDVAATLAFDTRMPAAQAVKVLEATANGQLATGDLRTAMAAAATPRIAGGGAERPAGTDAHSLASQIVAAGRKRRGEA